MPRRKNSNQDDGPVRSHLYWTHEMDNVLVDSLVEEKLKGNRPDGKWTTQAYDNMLMALRNHFGQHIQKVHIKSRLKTIKSSFGEVKDLFSGASGFGWNPITKTFEATTEVWAELIKSKPEAKKWMHHPVLNYDKLYEVYGEDRATGEYAESAREKVSRWQRESNSSYLDLNDGTFMPSDSETNWTSPANQPADNIGISSPDNTPSTGAQSEGATSSRGKKRKASTTETLESQYEMLHLGIKEVADVMREGNVIAEKSLEILEKGNFIAEKSLTILEGGNFIAEKSLDIMERGRPRHYREDEIFSELEFIGLHPNLQMQAYRFLAGNQGLTRQFFGLPRARRLEFLVQVMGESGGMGGHS